MGMRARNETLDAIAVTTVSTAIEPHINDYVY